VREPKHYNLQIERRRMGPLGGGDLRSRSFVPGSVEGENKGWLQGRTERGKSREVNDDLYTILGQREFTGSKKLSRENCQKRTRSLKGEGKNS